MKKKLFFTLISFSLLVLNACSTEDPGQSPEPDPEPVVPTCTFEVTLTQENRTLNLNIVPSEGDQTYVFGLLNHDEYLSLGEDTTEGLTSWINNRLVSGTMDLYTGNYSFSYEQLLWNKDYHVYVAQIVDNSVWGTPQLKDHKIYRASLTYYPEEGWIAPAYISDNGEYVVGNYEGSFIYHLPTDSLVILEGSTLYDITDDGVAYGQDQTGYPVRYENGELIFMDLTFNNSTEGTIFAVSPDGSLAAGYQFVDSWNIQPLYYRNNEVVDLDKGHDISGAPSAMACVKGIGSNGNMTGYLLDENYVEMGCMWDKDGNFDLYIEPFMIYNEGLHQWQTLYGTMFNFISPNGRYIASSVIEYSQTGLTHKTYSYVYDCQEDEMYVIRDEAAEGMVRVDCVSNDGVVFLSDVDIAYSSVPYCYDIYAEKLYKAEDYWKEKYDYEPDRPVIGTILAVSEDGKTYLAGCMETNFTTIVYFMR